MRLTVTMGLETDKKCKNSHRYFAVKGQTAVPLTSVYLMKEALPDPERPPAVIHVTIDTND